MSKQLLIHTSCVLRSVSKCDIPWHLHSIFLLGRQEIVDHIMCMHQTCGPMLLPVSVTLFLQGLLAFHVLTQAGMHHLWNTARNLLCSSVWSAGDQGMPGVGQGAPRRMPRLHSCGGPLAAAAAARSAPLTQTTSCCRPGRHPRLLPCPDMPSDCCLDSAAQAWFAFSHTLLQVHPQLGPQCLLL